MGHHVSTHTAQRMQASRDELAERIAQAAREDGSIELLEGVRLRRASSPTELGHGKTSCAFCVIAQGSKELLLGDSRYRYNPAQYLIAQRYLESLSSIATGANKLVFLPFEASGIMASLGGIKELLNAQTPAVK